MRFGLFFGALGLLAGLAVLTPTAANAQAAGAAVVASCGSASYTAGKTYPITQSTNGTGCVNATATVAVAPLTSTNLSGTISVTNTFQSIQVATAGRNGCLIQNASTTDAMWVFFGAIADATKAKAFELDANHGLAISCAVGGLGVVTDQVSITGTASDTFSASFQ